MNFTLALAVAVLYVSGFYLLLRRSLVKTIFGLMLLTYASNLVIFAAAGVTRGHSPIIGQADNLLAQPYADPLPQALILTAIVISFGVLAFFLALALRANSLFGTDNIESEIIKKEED